MEQDAMELCDEAVDLWQPSQQMNSNLT